MRRNLRLQIIDLSHQMLRFLFCFKLLPDISVLKVLAGSDKQKANKYNGNVIKKNIAKTVAFKTRFILQIVELKSCPGAQVDNPTYRPN